MIGIDYGQVRIGLSYSDERKILAHPLLTLQAEKKLERTAAKLLKELEDHQTQLGYEIEEIIIGLPLMMNGTVGLLADEVKQFVSEMEKITPIPIKMWDERLTSVQAERSLKEFSLSRKARSKHVDRVSAVILLQSYLDCRQKPRED